MNAPKVFVHGNPETAVVWDRLAGELEQRGVGPIHRLSPPAFGAPVPEGFAGSRTDYRDWLIGQLEAFGEPVDLVGHDWGAGHTYGVAAERPDLLRSWAAGCAGMLHPDYEWHAAAQLWLTPDVGEQVVALMTTLTAEAFAKGRDIDLELATHITDHLDDQMGAAILTLYRSAAQPALRTLGDQLAAAERRPALLIVPTVDEFVPAELAASVADRLGADVARFEGLGHWWMWNAPGQAAEALTAFWSRLP